MNSDFGMNGEIVVFEKMMAFAETGKGRRLINTLKKKDVRLSPAQLTEILEIYRDTGLPVEVMGLKSRRGILSEKQYDHLAEKVRINCCLERYEMFLIALKDLLNSGMKMNPTKMEADE